MNASFKSSQRSFNHAFILNTLTQRTSTRNMATRTTPSIPCAYRAEPPQRPRPPTGGIGSQRPENLKPAKMTQKTTYPYFRDYLQGQTPANPHEFRRPQKTIQLSIFLNIFIYIGVFIYMCAPFRKPDQSCKPCSLKAFRKNDRYLDTSPHFCLAHGVNTGYHSV